MLKKPTLKQKDDDVSHAFNAALGYLTAREYSKADLSKKLLLRYTKEAVADAIKKCIEYDYLSDSRYASILSKHIINQGYGPKRLLLEAFKHQVNSKLFAKVIDETCWQSVAVAYLNKKLKGSVDYDYAQKQKILAMLSRRGFSNSICLEALEQYLSENEQ